MKNKIIISIAFMLVVFVCGAQNANTIMNKVVSSYTSAKNVSADFELSSSQFKVKGNIVMSGMKFRILAGGFSCWCDGTTQWVYTTATKEVNVLEPTSEDLEVSNPYLAVMKYDTNYKAVMKSNTAKSYVVEMVAKNSYVDMSKILLTIDKNTYQIKEAVATMADNSTQVIKFSKYVVNAKLSGSTFVFDSKAVPSGTPVIDLR